MYASAHTQGNPGNGSRRAGAWNVSELIGHVFLHHLIDLPQ
jgi:hypothetical protein